MDNSSNIDRRLLIAPCGMDCGVCDKYLAYSHQIPKKRGKVSHCKGCRPTNKECGFIKQKCITGKIDKIDFCFNCDEYPCGNLKKVADSYRRRYSFDLLDNLRLIQSYGIDWFIKQQTDNHGCNTCGDIICIHNLKCYTCEKDKLIE